jgi:hypothetical protein
MCVGPLASKPKAPPIPPTPPPVEPPPQAQDPAVVRAKTKNKQQAALAQGRQSTVLTGGLGLTSGAETGAKKTLLGS